MSIAWKISSPCVILDKLVDNRMSCFISASSIYCTYAINTASSATVVVSSSWIEKRCIFNFSTEVFSTSFAILSNLSFAVLLDRGKVSSLEATCVPHIISIIFTCGFEQSFPDGVRLFWLGNEDRAHSNDATVACLFSFPALVTASLVFWGLFDIVLISFFFFSGKISGFTNHLWVFGALMPPQFAGLHAFIR